ncbi:hypothetical protein [Crocosphaera sp. XPORK-15E]|uniref:hypothetical protein n=1 Tax=Crocosphaera sp. XPORK-15E TaxID=3110247 RepID=UPI002B1FE2DC|nr:hypothetical protein [Crocosphaera sp. XPORK-15E]MEA5537374.1 hypothetical protein [Crocosphaera sp. XPORK-15E]
MANKENKAKARAVRLEKKAREARFKLEATAARLEKKKNSNYYLNQYRKEKQEQANHELNKRLGIKSQKPKPDKKKFNEEEISALDSVGNLLGNLLIISLIFVSIGYISCDKKIGSGLSGIFMTLAECSQKR